MLWSAGFFGDDMLYFRPIQQGLKCQHKCQVVSSASRFESQMPFFPLLSFSFTEEVVEDRLLSQLEWGIVGNLSGCEIDGISDAVVFISSDF